MKYDVFFLFILIFFSCNYPSSKQNISKIDSLSLLISEDALDISLFNKRSKLYLQKGNIQLAKKDIDDAYAIFKNDIDVLFNRGDIYFQLNETRISKESWERCVSLDPNNIPCREKLTNLLCAVRNPSCKSMIDTLSIINQGLVPVSLVAYLKEMKEYELAVKLLKNLLVIDSLDREVLSLSSLIYSDTSIVNPFFDMDLSNYYFNKIIKLYPNYFQAYYNFGKYKQNISKYQEALYYYSIAVDLDSLNVQTYYNMGFCAMQLRDYNLGVNYFTSAINLNSSFLMAYHARAYLYELLDNQPKAKLDWKNCLMLNPAYIPALKRLNK